MALADEGIYEYLQISIQKYLQETRKNHEDVVKFLDSLGFRVGYQIIERSLNITFLFSLELCV